MLLNFVFEIERKVLRQVLSVENEHTVPYQNEFELNEHKISTHISLALWSEVEIQFFVQANLPSLQDHSIRNNKHFPTD